MTDAHDHELEPVDRAARAASRGLHAHVDRHVDPELVLAAMPASEPVRRRGRLLAAAAVAALFIGSVAVLGGEDGEDRSRLEVDEDGNELPAPEPGVLTPLGPKDGRDSIRLPITVEPSVDLRDGQVVTASGPGFVPGERVGIVQCAREAGGEEVQAGIDGCNTGAVQYANADDEGIATGTFTVQRVLTTPATGTVDCALEAERCVVAMGALDDYDRSGGLGVTFAGGGEPIDVPTVAVTPAEGLADGDLVHVEGEGFQPNHLLYLEVCSIDPAACWHTGDEVELDPNEVEGPEFVDGGDMQGTIVHVGLVSDDDGRITGDVPVWRFLPTGVDSTYADCAVSECRIRVRTEGGHSPEPIPLVFTSGGSAPRPPAIAVDPTRDLVAGQEVVVRGAGFEPGSYYSISICIAPPGRPDEVVGCMSTDGGEERIEADGGFARTFEVPELDDLVGATATTMCSPDGGCASGSPPFEDPCDGATSECSIRVDSYQDAEGATAPQFPPAPVVVTLRQ